jgi:hypothetical protein
MNNEQPSTRDLQIACASYNTTQTGPQQLLYLVYLERLQALAHATCEHGHLVYLRLQPRARRLHAHLPRALPHSPAPVPAVPAAAAAAAAAATAIAADIAAEIAAGIAAEITAGIAAGIAATSVAAVLRVQIHGPLAEARLQLVQHSLLALQSQALANFNFNLNFSRLLLLARQSRQSQPLAGAPRPAAGC